MNQKQRRGKHPTSNINININLKVDTKHNQLAGKKIMQQKELHKMQQPIRPNHTIDVMNKKKLSCQQHHKNKLPVQGLNEDRTQNWYNIDQKFHENVFNFIDKENLMTKNAKANLRKRLKSKSLENLKVKYYARTPESVSKSHSKINSKSKSKSKSRKCKQNEAPSPKSFLHSDKKKSMSKSKSKSKSPLISKKRSLQTFKTREDFSQRQTEKDKSKDLKKDRQKIAQFIKKGHNMPLEKHTKTFTNLPKKLSEPITKNKLAKSKQKQKQSSPSKIPKYAPKNKPKKGKKPKKESKIYSQSYLQKMATKIQSVWRSYIVRKRLKTELNEISNKIASVRKQMNLKGSNFWQIQSNHSIIQLESESNKTAKSESVKNSSHRSAINECNNISPLFMVQIQKLRKKLEEQEDRFKMLEMQNNQLKANLNKIGTSPMPEAKKQGRRSQKELEMNRVVCMRIESEESEKDVHQDRRQLKKKQLSNKRRDIILGLPAVIRTEQSREEQEYAQMKKKMEYYQCSPKNESTLNVKFNKNVLKKLFSKQQEKLSEKYFRKSKEYTEMLKNQLVSPKTYELKCFQLQNRFKKEKEEYVNKYQQAERALLLIDQLQQQEQESSILQKQNKKRPSNDFQAKAYSAADINKNASNVSQKDSKSESPRKKTLNLFINVDQIDSNSQKYPPVISHNSHREQEPQNSREEQDLSQLYHKVMQEREITYKREQYLQKQQEQQQKIEQSPQQHKQQANQLETNVSKGSENNSYKGFQTNLKYIRSFYIKFCEFFRQVKGFREAIQENIATEIIFDKEAYLKSFRTFEEDSNSSQAMFPYYKIFASYNVSFPIQILNSYYQELTDQNSQLYQRETAYLKETSKQEYKSLGYAVYELKQYHDLALMDAFNESINFERPGGPQGSNLDDLTGHYHAICKSRVLNKLSPFLSFEQREQNLNILLGNTIGRVINQWACGLCGFINDTNEESEHLQESKLEEIRLQRLTLMLQKALLQEQNSMVNTFPFRLSVKLQAQKLITFALINQLVSDIYKITSK